jgi:hypothetical protein
MMSVMEESLTSSTEKNKFNKQKQAFAKLATVTTKPPLESLRDAYNARSKRSHPNGGSFILPSITDIDETILGESYFK